MTQIIEQYTWLLAHPVESVILVSVLLMGAYLIGGGVSAFAQYVPKDSLYQAPGLKKDRVKL